MTQRTYYEPDGPVWEWWNSPEPTMSHNGTPVRHGYTMADIESLARMAMRRSIGWSLLDTIGRYQACYDGVVDLLFTAEEPPTERDLIASGWDSLARAYKSQRHDRGLTDDPDQPHGPRFAAYWAGQSGSTSHADATDERVALHQVLDALPDEHRDAIAAMAAYGTRGEAAHGLNIKVDTYGAQLRRARERALRLWFDHEVPPSRATVFTTARKVGSYQQRTPATHCHAGHPWSPENTRWYRPPRSSSRGAVRRVCRACESARGVARRGVTA